MAPMRSTRALRARAGGAWVGAAIGLAGCARPPLMCTTPDECGASSSCVAGRCVAHGAAPAIGSARRVVIEPVDVGYVGANVGADGTGRGGPPAIAVLGQDGPGEGSKILLRFDVPLGPDVTVLEAYLLVDRVSDLDADPLAVALHAEAIVERWSSRSLSWAEQPRLRNVASPVTRVLPAGASPVRLDVRALVERWRRRDKDDFGVAIMASADRVAGVANATGIGFALEPRDAPTRALPHHQAEGPRLELYVKR